MNKITAGFGLLLVTLWLLVLLAACGGGESKETAQPTVVPPTGTAVDEVEETETPEKESIEKTVEPESTGVAGDEVVEVTGEAEVGGTPVAQESGLTAEIVSGELAGAGKPFTFDATQSLAGAYPIEAYEWDMGDGTYLFGLAVQHDYAEPGDYTVTLTIVDENGDRDSVSKVVAIVPLEELVRPTEVSQEPIMALIGTHWLMDNPMRGTIITLNFDEDDLSGSSGCNSYSASYTVTAADGPTTSIAVGSISGSAHSCTQEIMAQERFYLDILASTSHYYFNGDSLLLETDSGTLSFSLAGQ